MCTYSLKMEDYLQYMKTLRCQMNDVEDQATKISVEEQMQITTIQSLESNLTSAKSEDQKLKEETEQMMTAKGEICSQILDKQRKVATLESDCRTLTQTLELVHQERHLLCQGDIDVKFQQLQGWHNCRIPSPDTEVHDSVKETLDEEKVAAGARGKISNHLLTENANNGASKELMFRVDSATAKLDKIKRTKAKIAAENSTMKQRIERTKSQSNEFQVQDFVLIVLGCS
ncbi:hypothetical protein BT93_F2119 [Corymbia citriodora subsp. variegata]|nr:hypothetical protein BT93_F2119 [Corymbia citriodora subsp. variegata]